MFLNQPMMAVYYSVNIDYKTAAAMLAAYNAEGAVELMGDESVRTMLKHYKNAEIATAGIFLTKYMDYKHLRDAGRFSDAQENAYYKRIYRIVSQKNRIANFIFSTYPAKQRQISIHLTPTSRNPK